MTRWLTTIVFVFATMLGTAAPAAAAQPLGEPCPDATFPFVLAAGPPVVEGRITTVERGNLPLCVGTFIVTIGEIRVGSGSLLALHQADSVKAFFAGSLGPVLVPGVGPISGAFFGKLTFHSTSAPGTPLSGSGTLRVTFCAAGGCQTVIATFVAVNGVFAVTEVTVRG